jgi:hypothetical protein
MKLICQHCKQTFNSDRKNKKYCSRKCYTVTQKGKLAYPNIVGKRGIRPKDRVIKNCIKCNKKFWVRRKRDLVAKFCSKLCYMEYRWNNDNKCKSCSIEISKGKYCSKRCQLNYYNNTISQVKKKQFWTKKIELIKILGSKCLGCGIDDIRVLDIDHIDSSLKNIPKKRQYTNTRRLKDWNSNTNNLRLLCANCHRIHTWSQRNYMNVELMDK